MKVAKLITLDEDLIRKAKEVYMNLSGTLNRLLRERLKVEEIKKEKPEEEQKQKDFEERERERIMAHPLFETALAFWKSPIGFACIKKSREEEYLKDKEIKHDGI